MLEAKGSTSAWVGYRDPTDERKRKRDPEWGAITCQMSVIHRSSPHGRERGSITELRVKSEPSLLKMAVALSHREP